MVDNGYLSFISDGLAALVPDLGCKGSTLLCFRLVDPIYYGYSLFIKDLA
jgi:hypothetical protein